MANCGKAVLFVTGKPYCLQRESSWTHFITTIWPPPTLTLLVSRARAPDSSNTGFASTLGAFLSSSLARRSISELPHVYLPELLQNYSAGSYIRVPRQIFAVAPAPIPPSSCVATSSSAAVIASTTSSSLTCKINTNGPSVEICPAAHQRSHVACHTSHDK